jgi:hypothetical protein
MADNVTLNTGSGGATLSTDDIAGVQVQRVKVQYGVDGAATDVSDTNPMPVDDAGGSLTIDNAALSVTGGGVEASALRVTIASDSTGVLSVDDNGASLTVDNAALSVTGAGVEASALRVTIATDSTGVLSVDDNGGSLTVDNAALSVTGGGVEASALRVTIATDSTGVLSIDDNSGSLTVDNAALSVVGGGAEATALRVTIASDSTGVLSIDDNGGSITVDGTVTANATLAAETTKVIGTVNIAAAQTIATTNAGTFAVQVDGAALTALQLIDNIVSGSGVNVSQINGVAPTMGNGASGTGVQRVTLANDSTGIVQLAAGTAGIGKLTANSGVDIGDVDVTSISAGTNLIGNVGIGVRTSGGTSIHRSIDLDEGALEVVKASAGQVYWIHAINLASTVRYVKFYNATSGTVGTGTPVLTFPIPTQGSANGAGFTLQIPMGIAFSTGICVGASTGVADADTGAPGANEVIINIGFA